MFSLRLGHLLLYHWPPSTAAISNPTEIQPLCQNLLSCSELPLRAWYGSIIPGVNSSSSWLSVSSAVLPLPVSSLCSIRLASLPMLRSHHHSCHFPFPPPLQILTLEPNSAAKVKPDGTALPGHIAPKCLAGDTAYQSHLDMLLPIFPNPHQTSLVP